MPRGGVLPRGLLSWGRARAGCPCWGTPRPYDGAMNKDSKSADTSPKGARSALGRFQKISLGGLALLFVLSLGARAFGAGSAKSADADRSAPGAATLVPAGGQSFVGGETPSYFPPTGEDASLSIEADSEPGALEAMLPVLTEASFFAMIGFALGYASRKVVKLALIVLAGFFLLLQLMTYGGVTTIDWGRLIDILNDWILNLKENQSITEVLTDRVPTAGSLIAGYFIGFRRG